MKANQIEVGGVTFIRTFSEIGFDGYLCRRNVAGGMQDSIVPRPLMPLKSRHEQIGGIPPLDFEQKYLTDFLSGKLDE